jgi:formamidopyrimidine-DNA glycosylase
MFELPEYTILASQMNQTLVGKTIQQGTLGNAPHKFVWYNRTHEEFEQLTQGKRVGEAHVRGRWLFLDLDPGYRLVLGECGGKVLFHPHNEPIPARYHLMIRFTDGSFVTVMTTMWGAMELFQAGEEKNRQYIKSMRTTPVDPEFTLQYFIALIDELLKGEKRSVKSLLTQDQLLPGLGNAIAQDIMFNARLHPRHPLGELTNAQREELFHSVVDTVQQVIHKGGRSDETDLYGALGGYKRKMDKDAAGNPCKTCGTIVEQIQYLGGKCYFCSQCQE